MTRAKEKLQITRAKFWYEVSRPSLGSVSASWTITGCNLHWGDNLCPKKSAGVIWLVKINKRILAGPAALSREERGLIFQTAAGNRPSPEFVPHSPTANHPKKPLNKWKPNIFIRNFCDGFTVAKLNIFKYRGIQFWEIGSNINGALQIRLWRTVGLKTLGFHSA